MWAGVNRSTVAAEIRGRLAERQKELYDCLRQALIPSPYGHGLKLNLSFDEWTCIGITAWITITVTWCSRDGQFQRRIATLRPFGSEVTAVTGKELRSAVGAFFKPVLRDDQDVVSILNSVTTDTAAVPMSAFKDEPHLRIGCICHVINLIFSDLLAPERSGSSTELQTMVRDIKVVLAKFAKSSKVRRAYAAQWARVWPGEKALQPIYDVVTRWSSTFHLIVRFMCMWPVLRNMTADQLNFGKQTTDAGWTDLRAKLQIHVAAMPDVAALLAPFFGWTEFFQTGAVTASFVCQAATELCDTTAQFAANVTKTHFVRAIADAVNKATVARLGSYVNVRPGQPQPNGAAHQLHALTAQLADPRTWAVLVTKLTSDEQLYVERNGADARADLEVDGRFVLRYLYGTKTAAGGLATEIEQRYGAPASIQQQTSSDVWGLRRAAAPASTGRSIASEIADYVLEINDGVIPSGPTVDVLSLLMKPEYQMRFPQWSAIQASVLSSTPASAEPERVFSLAATIKSLRRNRLSPAMLEALVVLKSDTHVRASGVNGPSRLWHRRVAMAILILHGSSRSKARVTARTLSSELPLEAVNSIMPVVGTAVQAEPREVLGLVDDEDDEDDDFDDGDVMANLLDAGAKVNKEGSIVLDMDTIAVLEGDSDDVMADRDADQHDHGDDNVLDTHQREAATQAVWDTLDRRTSARLAGKSRRSWHDA